MQPVDEMLIVPLLPAAQPPYERRIRNPKREEAASMQPIWRRSMGPIATEQRAYRNNPVPPWLPSNILGTNAMVSRSPPHHPAQKACGF